MYAICLTMMALAAVPTSNADKFINRVENTELLINGRKYQRVTRDANGDVIYLRLDNMRLSAADFRVIGDIESLQVLSLRRTNVADENLRCLRELKHLRALILTSTEVSDAAVDEVLRMDELRSTCLGDVLITPDAIANLKAKRPKLAIGYSPRKLPTR